MNASLFTSSQVSPTFLSHKIPRGFITQLTIAKYRSVFKVVNSNIAFSKVVYFQDYLLSSRNEANFLNKNVKILRFFSLLQKHDAREQDISGLLFDYCEERILKEIVRTGCFRGKGYILN